MKPVARKLDSPHPGISQVVDSLWGHDVFLSHRRSDGATYATRLFETLGDLGIRSFIDRNEYLPADSLVLGTRRHVAKSTVFVLLLTPDVAAKRKPDWVEEELDAYLATHKEPKVLVVDFAGAAVSERHRIRRKIAPFLRIDQPLSALDEDPIAEIGKAAADQLRGRRRDATRLRVFRGAALALSLLLVLLGFVAAGFLSERITAQGNERRALAALARSTLAEDNPLKTTILALAAWPRSDGFGEVYQQSVLSTVSTALGSFGLPTPVVSGPFSGIDMSRDHSQLVAWSGQSLRLFDADSNLPLTPVMTSDSVIFGAILAPSADRVLTWGPAGDLCQWDARQGQRMGCCNPADFIKGVGYNRDETRILVWSGDEAEHQGSVDVVDARTCKPTTMSMRHDEVVRGARFSDDESLILAWSFDGVLRVWDATTGEPVGQDMRWTQMLVGTPQPWEQGPAGFHGPLVPDANPQFLAGHTRVLSSTVGQLVLWDTATGRELLRGDPIVNWVGATPDETRLVLRQGPTSLQIYDVVSAAPVGPPLVHHATVAGVSFAADGSRLLSWDAGGDMYLWDLKSGEQIGPAMHHPSTPDGADLYGELNRIVSWSGINAFVWDATTGQLIATTTLNGSAIAGSTLSPDGEQLLSWSDKRLYASDAASGRVLGVPMVNGAAVAGALFSKDAKRALSWSSNGSVYSWDLQLGRRVAHTTLPATQPVKVAVTTDGERVVAWSESDVLWFWEPGANRLRSVRSRNEVPFDGARLNGDGSRVLSWDAQGRMQLWDFASASSIGQEMLHGSAVKGAAFDGENKRIVSWSADGRLQVWSVDNQRAVASAAHQGDINGASFSPGDKVAFWSGRDVKVLDASNGQISGQATAFTDYVIDARFLQSGELLASASIDGSMAISRTSDGSSVRKASIDKNGYSSARFDTEGRRVLLANSNQVEVWDTASATRIGATIEAKTTSVDPGRLSTSSDTQSRPSFSRDGKRLISLSTSGFLRVWDATSSKRVGKTILAKGDDEYSLEDSRDGTRLLSRGGARIRLWDPVTGEQIGPDMVASGDLAGAVFGKDDKTIVSWTTDGHLEVWDVDWPKGHLLAIACGVMSTDDVQWIEGTYGIVDPQPICTPQQASSFPSWSRIERTAPSVGDEIDVVDCSELSDRDKAGALGQVACESQTGSPAGP